MKKDLPAGIEVPAGWTAEWSSDGDRFIVITSSPSRYMVTLDLEQRGFRAGMSTTSRMTSTMTYTGRGWRSQLCVAGLQYLRHLEEDIARQRARAARPTTKR